MIPGSSARRSILISASAITVLLLSASVASADAVLVEAVPEAGSTVQGSPSEISATFDQELGEDGSSIILRGPDGEDVAEGDVDPQDSTRLVIPAVPSLGPGAYEVRYAAASADGHLVRDTWTFVVEAAATATPAPAVTPSDAPSDPPSPSPTQASAGPSAPPDPVDPAPSTSDVLVPIVVVLALVGIGGAYFLRRRSGPGA